MDGAMFEEDFLRYRGDVVFVFVHPGGQFLLEIFFVAKGVKIAFVHYAFKEFVLRLLLADGRVVRRL